MFFLSRFKRKQARIQALEDEVSRLQAELARAHSTISQWEESVGDADAPTAFAVCPQHLKHVSDNAATISGELFEPMSYTYNTAGLLDSTITGMGRLYEILHRINDSVQENQAMVDRLSEHTDAVRNFVQRIQKISSQSKMLSMNAAIEAARVGQQGKSFAIVADEMGGLSDDVKQVTEEIGQQLFEIQTDTDQTQVFFESLHEWLLQIDGIAGDVDHSTRETGTKTRDLQMGAYRSMCAGHILGILGWAYGFYLEMALAFSQPEQFRFPLDERQGTYLGEWLYLDQDNEFEFRSSKAFSSVEAAYRRLMDLAEEAREDWRQGNLASGSHYLQQAGAEIEAIRRGMGDIECYLNQRTNEQLYKSADSGA